MADYRRIIPCLDVKDGKLVKGVHFVELKDVGDPAEIGAKYAEEGADEIVFLDITATVEKRKTMVEVVRRTAKGIKVPEKTKHFCYCHTPTRYLWSDLESYVAKLKIPDLTKKMVADKLKGLRQWDYDAAQRVDYFIANSEFISGKIKKYYDRDAKVIYPPVEVNKFYSNPQKEDYYIVVSRLMPYKKVDLIVKAFNQLKLPLKVLGTGEHAEELKRMAKNNIEFLGEVSDEVRGKYLSKARAFLHPQEEDFGIAAVEAMASGCPVIAYGSGGALETIIDKETGIFFEEQNWESLAEAVLDFNKLKFNPKVIQEYAQKFSSENFRKNIDEYIKENS